MPSKNLSSFITLADKNGLEVGAWAKPSLPGFATCTWCPNTTINFQKTSRKLTIHSETEKHIKNKPKEENPSIQLTMEEALSDVAAAKNKELEMKEQARSFELDLVRSFSRHRIPFEYVDCLQSLLKKHLGENEIVNNMHLHNTKARYLVKNAISPVYQEQTIKMLRECDAFVIAFDESEVNKRSELELMVKLAHPNHGIQLRHYQTIDLENGEAATIVAAIFDALNDDGIDFNQKLITATSDGCNTNEGHKGGVKKLMSQQVHQFKDVGSCNDHHVGNAFEYGVKAFDADCHEALVDIYQDLGGAKGKGLKKKKAFEEVCRNKGVQAVSFKKLCTTRFRSYVLAIQPVLSNWHGIHEYYSKAKKLTDRQKRLKSFFVDRDVMTKLKLSFIWSSSKYMIEALDFFEQRREEVHNIHAKMMEILVSSFKKHLQPQVSQKMDDDENVIRKSPRELLEADMSNLLSRKKVFIGDKCAKIIKDIGLVPFSPQLNWFFDKVFAFHKTVSVYLMKYFKKGLLSTDLKYFTALSPKNRSNYQTAHMLKYLVTSLSKIVENIAQDGMDRVANEIDVYTTDEEALQSIDSNLSYEAYWNAVRNLKDGEWAKYDILPRFALAIGTFFNSNSDVECAFSVETDINRDPKKNRMGQDMLEAHMQIHYGVESSLNYDKSTCKQCQSTRKRPHCHCSQAIVSKEMLSMAKKARSEEHSKVHEDVTYVLPNCSDDLLLEEKKRMKELKENLKTRKTFYSPNLMEDVYEREAKKRKLTNDDDNNSKVQELPAKISKQDPVKPKKHKSSNDPSFKNSSSGLSGFKIPKKK